MKKREFQKRATVVLFKRLINVCEDMGENPNITVSSKYHSSYFKLRCNYNMIQISVKQTGEISYRLTDMLGSSDGQKTYFWYMEGDDYQQIIEKFAEDFGRLYEDFLKARTLHGFDNICMSYDSDAGEALREYEDYIVMGCL